MTGHGAPAGVASERRGVVVSHSPRPVMCPVTPPSAADTRHRALKNQRQMAMKITRRDGDDQAASPGLHLACRAEQRAQAVLRLTAHGHR